MHSPLRYLAAISALTALANAQNFLPTSASSTFPACAASCVVLQQAQSLCVPPTVAASSEVSYENCFCQSSYLQALYNTPDAICTGECTVESDRQLLQQWFTGFCQQVGQGINPLTTTSTTATATQGSTTVVTITSTSNSNPTGATITGSGSTAQAAPSSNKSWFELHWKWVVMLIVLFFGLIGVTVLAIWLKKRHRRKVSAKRASISGFIAPTSESREKPVARAMSATPDLWGPHQHMHATKGWEYHSEADTSMAGAVDSNERREKHRSRRFMDSRDSPDVWRAESQKKPSRQRSSKGKRRASVDAAERSADDTDRPVSRSGRSGRKHRHRGRERSNERDTEKGYPGEKF